MKLVLSQSADEDIAQTLSHTIRLFGNRQFSIYSLLIEETLDLIAGEPLRASSRDRSDLSPGIRSLHMGVAAMRMRAAAHIVFYLAPECGTHVVYVLRLLHHSMEPTSYVRAALRDIDRT